MRKPTRQDLLYLFILISPILDICSSLFRFGNYSISLFLRPVIPLLLLIYITITDKKVRKYIIGGGIIYCIYAIFHLLIFKNLITDFSYGNLIYEASYLCNYTYLIFTLFLFLYLFRSLLEFDKLKKCFVIYVAFYIISIYVAIITNTSYTTYMEGTGYRGWYNTGGAVGSILIGSLFILLPYLFKKKNYLFIKLLLVASIIFYLTFLLGTRVGLLGSIIVLICYFVFHLIYSFIHSTKMNKKMLLVGIISFIVLVIGCSVIGSESLKRRAELEELNGKIPGTDSTQVIYMAYDLVELKEKLDNKELDKKYMLEEQKQALFELDRYSTIHELKSTSLREQQLLYHHFLYHNQKDISLKLVGNGYLTNMGMLTLEMEIIALWYNFGIIGFLLFIGPFLALFCYSVYQGIKYYKQVDVSYMMLVSGCFMTYMISIMAGHTYFNTSVMIVIILLHTFLYKKARNLKKGGVL